MVRIQKAVHLRAHLIYYSILYSCSEEYVFPVRVFSYSKSNPTLKNKRYRWSQIFPCCSPSKTLPITHTAMYDSGRTAYLFSDRSFKRISKFRGCEAGKITRTFSGCRCSLLVLLSPLCEVFEQAHFRHWNHPISLFICL